jgi:hypothetical protein
MKFGRPRSATHAVTLPQFEPWTVRKRLIVSSIGSRDVAGAERTNIRRFEHFLKLLNLVNDAFHIHARQSSKKTRGLVNRKRPRIVTLVPFVVTTRRLYR